MSKYDGVPGVQPLGDQAGPRDRLIATLQDAIGDLDAGRKTPEEIATALRSQADTTTDEAPEARRHRLETVRRLVGTFAPDAFQRMRNRALGLERRVPVPWGTLQDLLRGGLRTGAHVLVAGTKSGKSQFALQIGLEAAIADVPVLYVGLELEEVGLTARLSALLYSRLWASPEHRQALDRLWRQVCPNHRMTHAPRRVMWSDLDWGTDPALVDFVEAAVAPTLETLPFRMELVPARGWPARRLLSAATDLREVSPLEIDANGDPIRGSRPLLLILDFLQLVGEDDTVSDTQDLRTRIAHASGFANDVSNTLDAAVLLVSSTARENYAKLAWDPPPYHGKGAKKKGKAKVTRPALPMLAGLGKESGDIEYSATTVMALGREMTADDEMPAGGWTMWLGVPLQRNGRPGWVPLRFDGSEFHEPSEREREALLEAYTSGHADDNAHTDKDDERAGGAD